MVGHADNAFGNTQPAKRFFTPRCRIFLVFFDVTSRSEARPNVPEIRDALFWAGLDLHEFQKRRFSHCIEHYCFHCF